MTLAGLLLSLALPAAAQQDSSAAFPQVGDFLADSAPIGGAAPRVQLPLTIEIPFPSLIQATDSEAVRKAAEADPGLKILVDKARRELRLMTGSDALFTASVAVGSGKSFESDGKRFTFETPVGKRRVLGKQKDPLWTPPDWHYYEVAAAKGLEISFLEWKKPAALSKGRSLEVRSDEVGLIDAAGQWAPMMLDEQIVFDGILFVPPFGTVQRKVSGILGPFKLDMGEGFLIHGTNPGNAGSIGQAASHGCVRLANEKLTELYPMVPVGTPVYIY